MSRGISFGEARRMPACREAIAAKGSFPYPHEALGKRAPPPKPKIPTPPDLPELAAKMGRNALALHYGISYNTIVRMLNDAGIEALQTQAPPRPVERRRIPPSQLRGYSGPKSAFVGQLPRDHSAEGEAADFLRRETRAALHRCDDKGRWTETAAKRTHWLYGGRVLLSGPELIERARARGFDSRQWSRLPAHISPTQRQGVPHSEGAVP